MLLLILVTLGGLVVAIGAGFVAVALLEKLRGPFGRDLTLGEVGLLGLAFLGTAGTLLNAVVALSPSVTGSFAVLAALVFVVRIGAVWRAHRAHGAPVLVPALAFLAVLIWASRYAYLSAPYHFDTGLYHAQAIRQVVEYPLILGSANIHMRFGYNSSWPLVSAMLSLGLPQLWGAFAVNFVMLALVAWCLAWRAWEGLMRAEGSAVFAALACLLMFTPAIAAQLQSGNPNTDLPIILLTVLCFHLALRVLEPASRGEPMLMLALLAGFAVTVKLSALPLAVVLVPLMLWFAWRGGRLGGRDIVAGVLAGSAIGLPWLLRGIASSGCLAYPHPASCLPVPWRVDPAVALSDMAWMRAWARRPDTPPEQVLGDWGWLPGWLEAFPRDQAGQAALILAALALAVALARAVLPAAAPRRKAGMAVLVMAALAGLAFWFATAPLLRYGAGWLILPSMLLLSATLPDLLRRVAATRRGAAMAGRGRAAVERARLAMGMRPDRWRMIVLLGFAGWAALFLHGTRRQVFATDFPRLPVVASLPAGKVGDLVLTRPATGQQCWDAPRICTPYPADGLHMARWGIWRMVHATAR